MPQLDERRDETAAAFRGHFIEKEVREIETGEGAAVVEVTESAFVAGVGEALTLIQPPASELELVASLEPRVLITELVGLDVVEFGTASVAESEVADAERAQPGDWLVARNADARIGFADSRPVDGNRLELHVREADEQLVQGGWRQRAVPVEREPEERRIIRRDQIAFERRPLRLRFVVLVRHAPEEPVALRRVPMEFHISLVDPLLVRRRRNQVVGVAGAVRQRIQRLVRQDRARNRAEA